MREIKFRIWENRIMNYNPSTWFAESTINDEFDNDRNVMQFTGYIDINKKDIYENDIVRIQGLDDIYKIEFINGCWLLVYCGIMKKLVTTYYLNAWQNDLIVIGNIYENPELLEQGRELL